MDDSTIMCDETIELYDEKTKTIPTKFNEKKATCKTQNFTWIFINYYSIMNSC